MVAALLARASTLMAAAAGRDGFAVRQLAGVTHADQVRCYAASEGLEVGRHIAPQAGRLAPPWPSCSLPRIHRRCAGPPAWTGGRTTSGRLRGNSPLPS